ncbi:hypothetical protein GCM10009601_49580 [Streptomyces thermospinosisporus]|uniref:Uncharacterized protein n=2 Tax=Streptomyces thermospinosisporus TaxID=161482 RepID=A0ABN1Z7I4_9ACTN
MDAYDEGSDARREPAEPSGPDARRGRPEPAPESASASGTASRIPPGQQAPQQSASPQQAARRQTSQPPISEQSVAQPPVSEPPVSGEAPFSEQPVSGEAPFFEQPVSEQPVSGEAPFFEQPVSEQPGSGEAPADDVDTSAVQDEGPADRADADRPVAGNDGPTTPTAADGRVPAPTHGDGGGMSEADAPGSDAAAPHDSGDNGPGAVTPPPAQVAAPAPPPYSPTPGWPPVNPHPVSGSSRKSSPPPLPASPPDPPTGIAALSLRYRIAAAVALAAVAVTVCAHLGMTFLHVAPPNTVSKEHGEVIEEWIYPEFEQNWKLFAPNPLQQNIGVQVRAEIGTPDGGVRTTRWYDLSAEDGRAIDGNPLPSHTQQNELRRAWDFFVATHDEKNRPVGLRGALSESYLRRIAVLRLDRADVAGDGGVIQQVQIRSRTANVPPPEWSDEKISTAPVYRTLPWWSVPKDAGDAGDAGEAGEAGEARETGEAGGAGNGEDTARGGAG